MPEISIIIPAYNEERYIGRTIDSVIHASKGRDVEIIVVANGCTDRTAEISKKKGAKVITTTKRGISASKNTGAKKADGEILIFLDADTHLSGKAVTVITAALARCSVGSLWVRPDNTHLRAKLLMALKNSLYASGIWKGTNGIIFTRKEIFTRVSGFDEGLKKREDSDFVYKAARQGRYCYLRKAYVVTSMRRYEKKGYLWVIGYWIAVWLKGMVSGNEADYPTFR